MSFLSKLLGRRTPDQRKYVLAMAEMAAESDRTYRGMIDTYNSDVAIGLLSVPQEGTGAVPTGRGLYKARLYGALFMVMAYAKAVTPAPDVEEFMNLAEARWFAQHRLSEHNVERPHSSLGYQTPSEFAAGLTSAPARQTGSAPPAIAAAPASVAAQAEATAKANGARGVPKENPTRITQPELS